MSSISYRYCPQCAAHLQRQEKYLACVNCCGFIYYDNPIPVVAAIVELPQGVVLVHSRSWPAKIYGLPTGFVEQGEDPADAVLREVKEELGLNGVNAELVGVFPFSEQNQILIAYHMSATEPVILGDELDGYKIIAIEKLRGWNFGTGLAINSWLEKITSSHPLRCRS